MRFEENGAASTYNSELIYQSYSANSKYLVLLVLNLTGYEETNNFYSEGPHLSLYRSTRAPFFAFCRRPFLSTLHTADIPGHVTQCKGRTNERRLISCQETLSQ